MQEEVQPSQLVSNPTIYIFLNKSLNMSVGKASSQAAHAAVLVGLQYGRNVIWRNAMHRTIIVLEGRDEQHLRNIQDYLSERNINTVKVIDEGVNEIEPHVCSALATTIVDKDDPEIAKALSTFYLYRDRVRLTIEMDK